LCKVGYAFIQFSFTLVHDGRFIRSAPLVTPVFPYPYFSYMPSYIDLFLLIPFGLAAWRGWKNGLVMEIFYLLALFAGLYGGFYLSDYAAQILRDKAGMTSDNMPIISFVIVFAIILVGLYFLGKLITQTVSAGGGEKWNQFGGALFSLTKAALFLSVIFLFVDSVNQKTGFIPEEQTDKSYLYKPLKNFSVTILPMVKGSDFYRELYDHGSDMVVENSKKK